MVRAIVVAAIVGAPIGWLCAMLIKFGPGPTAFYLLAYAVRALP